MAVIWAISKYHGAFTFGGILAGYLPLEKSTTSFKAGLYRSVFTLHELNYVT